MAVTEPDQVIHQFATYFNAGDLTSLVQELYEDGAVFVASPEGPNVQGKEAITGVGKAFLDTGGTLSIVSSSCVTNGDIGLTHSRWRLDLPEGEPMEHVSAEVVRRQADGSWRYTIDNPFGGEVVGG